jgi:hypothetical protein
MLKSPLPYIAILASLSALAPATSFAEERSPAHNYQETQSQRDVAALHDASDRNQTAATVPQQASAK